MKKILIVHGWMHSAERYSKLADDIQKKLHCKVVLYEIPGFGETKPIRYTNLLKGYSDDLVSILCDNNYDYVIGHSMGGNLLLRALEKADVDSKLILLSPEYRGISYLKPLTILCPIMPLGLFALQKINCGLTDFFMKIIALLTVNRWAQIDDRIIIDSRSANPIVATVAMFELAWDAWRVTRSVWQKKQVSLILGQNDRIILKNKMRQLQRDLPCCNTYQLFGIGHTAVVEAYDELFNILKNIICAGDKDDE